MPDFEGRSYTMETRPGELSSVNKLTIARSLVAQSLVPRKAVFESPNPIGFKTAHEIMRSALRYDPHGKQMLHDSMSDEPVVLGPAILLTCNVDSPVALEGNTAALWAVAHPEHDEQKLERLQQAFELTPKV